MTAKTMAPRVGLEVVAEIEVAREFAAEDAVGVGQGLLHEDVADAFALGNAAGVEDFLLDDAAGAAGRR